MAKRPQIKKRCEYKTAEPRSKFGGGQIDALFFWMGEKNKSSGLFRAAAP
jgi:hypothetical protein